MREELLASGVQDTVVDDAVLILSELLSNSCRYARPICTQETAGSVRGAAADAAPDAIRAAWRIDAHGQLTISVTDGGGPTRPQPSTPSVTAKGGRGLAIIRSLAKEWGVEDTDGEVTVWALLALHGLRGSFATRVDLPAEFSAELSTELPSELSAELPSELSSEFPADFTGGARGGARSGRPATVAPERETAGAREAADARQTGGARAVAGARKPGGARESGGAREPGGRRPGLALVKFDRLGG